MDELDAISANPDYLTSIDDALKQQGADRSSGPLRVPSTPGSLPRCCNRQLQFALIHNEVERRGLTAGRRVQAGGEGRPGPRHRSGNDAQQGEATLAGFPEDYRNKLEGWYVDEYALQADLAHQPCGSDAVAKAYFDAHTEDFTQDCVSLIAVNDENLANSIVAQTRAGGDFAALASQYSTDEQTARPPAAMPVATTRTSSRRRSRRRCKGRRSARSPIRSPTTPGAS